MQLRRSDGAYFFLELQAALFSFLGMSLKSEDLRIGMRVKHPQAGFGVVRSIGENVAEIRFDEGTRRISPETAELEAVDEVPSVADGTHATDVPVDQIIRDTISEMLSELNIEQDNRVVEGLASRWNAGKMVLHPADPTLQTKEVPIETFFHKIVMMRNNLRTLEQKVNGNSVLSEGDKFELQQYITRCYGSMTTFNVLFGSKEDQFNTKA